MSTLPRSYFLENLLTHEVSELVPRKFHRVLIPCGALEAHGAAGLGTDTIIPSGLAERIAPALEALIAPAMPVGVLRSLARYPGSVSFTPATYSTLMYEYGSGLLNSGFDQVVFLNGHAGNTAGLKDAAHKLYMEKGVAALVYDWYREPDDITRELYDGPGGHSGAAEAGLVRALRPEAAPDGIWRPEDAGTLNPAISSYPSPFPIMLEEEGVGLPDLDDEKSGQLLDQAAKQAIASLKRVLERWDALNRE